MPIQAIYVKISKGHGLDDNHYGKSSEIENVS